jgi:hypothetical protein
MATPPAVASVRGLFYVVRLTVIELVSSFNHLFGGFGLCRVGWGYKKAPISGAFLKRMMGLEPTTFCMASRRSSQLSYIRARGGL